MNTRRILFNQLAIDAKVGILQHELRQTQPIYIDMAVDVAILQPTVDEDIHSVLDYRAIRETAIEVCTGEHIYLIETVAERIAKLLLARFPEVLQVMVRVAKPLAFSDCQSVAIEVNLSRGA